MIVASPKTNPKDLKLAIPVTAPRIYPPKYRVRPIMNNEAKAMTLDPPILLTWSALLNNMDPNSPANMTDCSMVLYMILLRVFNTTVSLPDAGVALADAILIIIMVKTTANK